MRQIVRIQSGNCIEKEDFQNLVLAKSSRIELFNNSMAMALMSGHSFSSRLYSPVFIVPHSCKKVKACLAQENIFSDFSPLFPSFLFT